MPSLLRQVLILQPRQLSFCLLLQDTPDGSYAALEKKGKKQKANLAKEMLNGLTNYRIWLLAACYAYSFGVEVTCHAAAFADMCLTLVCRQD